MLRRNFNFTAMRLSACFLVVLGVMLAVSGTACASQENSIKAAYLYQITQFVEWPEPRPSPDAFHLCVFGVDQISNKLAPLHMREEEGGHIEVLFPTNLIDTLNCEIIYISKEKAQALSSILKALQNKPVVTVSSIKDFVKSGGMIGFTIINNTVRLEINHSAAIRAGIYLNAKLLEIASFVMNSQSGGKR
ncbi:MAG: YfiR family protein [Gammaproteobacteria bacterium]|nr:YfiR family protein [Gammaproteobacteria bacterium]